MALARSRCLEILVSTTIQERCGQLTRSTSTIQPYSEDGPHWSAGSFGGAGPAGLTLSIGSNGECQSVLGFGGGRW